MNAAIRKGRELAAWVKEGGHRQGDGYVAGMYFFTTPKKPEIIEEGLELVHWSFDQACKAGGCGRHVVPAEPVAHAQVKALAAHCGRLPTVLGEFGVIMRGLPLKERSEEVRQIAELVLCQLFERQLLAKHTDHAAGDQPGDSIAQNERHILENFRDARTLASYFYLSLPTLARSLEMSAQS